MRISNGDVEGLGSGLGAQWVAGSVHAEQLAWLPGAHTYTCTMQSGVPNRVVGLKSELRLGPVMVSSNNGDINSDGSSYRSEREVAFHMGQVLGPKVGADLPVCLQSLSL